MTTQPPTQEPVHHCVNCGRLVSREDPEWPWKDRQGRWQCPRHPRAGQSKITPHIAAPGHRP